jgi:hypothetical protein
VSDTQQLKQGGPGHFTQVKVAGRAKPKTKKKTIKFKKRKKNKEIRIKM